MAVLSKRIKKYIIDICYLIEHTSYKIMMPLYISYCKKCKISNYKVLFWSKPILQDNANALYRYLQENLGSSNKKFVWLVDGEEVDKLAVPSNVEFVNYYSKRWRWRTYKSIKHIMTSKYVFFSHASPFTNLPKRDEQVIVNLWHGCGYKDTNVKQDEKWIDKNPFDFALVPGKLFIDIKARMWECEKNQILAIGYPRYDLMYENNRQAEAYSQELKGRADKLIMWLPTFRKSIYVDYPEGDIQGDFDLPLLDSEQQLVELNQFCADHNMVICIKRHPSQTRYSVEDRCYANIKFCDNTILKDKDVELYELLPYTDGLISDYSSVAVDYLLLNKPIGFALADFDDYQRTRGFVFENPLEYMPGHHIYAYSDLLIFLNDISQGNDRYMQMRESLMPVMHNPCDNYCQRILDYIGFTL